MRKHLLNGGLYIILIKLLWMFANFKIAHAQILESSSLPPKDTALHDSPLTSESLLFQGVYHETTPKLLPTSSIISTFKVMALNPYSLGHSSGSLSPSTGIGFQQSQSKAAEIGLSFIDLESGIIACQFNETSPLKVHNITIICDGKVDCMDGADETNEHCKAKCEPECEKEKGVCLLGTSNLPGKCYCVEGYSGETCSQEDDNECIVNPCGNYALCTNTVGSFKCECIPGFTGDGFDCEDLNECEEGTHNCNDDEVCFNLQGTYKCGDCPAGTRKSDKICLDVDECSERKHDCDVHAQCFNVPESYGCVCREGFAGDGKVCMDIDECSSDIFNKCHEKSVCSNFLGSYNCTCMEGFIGNGFNCTKDSAEERTDLTMAVSDPDHVQEEEAICDDFCDANAECVNPIIEVLTSAQLKPFCKCKSGFQGNGLVCSDIDECSFNETNFCGLNKVCINAIGSYVCVCESGYKLVRGNCENIDECKTSSPCPPNSRCSDKEGKFQCICNKGYTMVQNKCIDIDECSYTKNVCPKNSVCHNLNGSFACDCNPGFVKIEKNIDLVDIIMDNIETEGNFDSKCEDINECEGNNSLNSKGPCTEESNSLCINNIGGYSCGCKSGYYRPNISGTNKTGPCVDIDECNLSPQNSTLNSLKLFSPKNSKKLILTSAQTYSYLFDKTNIDGYSDFPTNSNISKCPEELGLICRNIPGSYECLCRDGFKPIGSINEENDSYPDCVDIDECDEDAKKGKLCGTVENSGCVNTVGGYQCKCLPGFVKGNINIPDELNVEKSKNDDNICVDIDECQVFKRSWLGNNVTDSKYDSYDFCTDKLGIANSLCQNTKGWYECVCSPGFYKVSLTHDPLKEDDFVCQDIDECELSSWERRVHNEAFKMSFIKSLKNNQIYRDILTNFDIDNNDLSSHLNTTIVQSLFLKIRESFEEDIIPERHDDNHVCSFIIKDSTCSNKNGTFDCGCDTGFKMDFKTLKCVDINECDVNSTDICLKISNSYCSNDIGGYECKCLPGYNLNISSNQCQDVNECLKNPCKSSTNRSSSISNTLLVDPICINSQGGYKCICPNGFKEKNSNQNKSNLLTCEDIDECEVNNLNEASEPPCFEVSNSICLNTLGSYDCICPTGFNLTVTKKQNSNISMNHTINACVDINECSVNNSILNDCITRIPGSVCNNTEGGFECVCAKGMVFKSKKLLSHVSVSKLTFAASTPEGTCEDINECRGNISGPCPSKDHVCQNTFGSFKCVCSEGYVETILPAMKNKTDAIICQDIDECVSIPNPCFSLKNTICINYNGSFACQCLEGYHSVGNGTNCVDINECETNGDWVNCDSKTSLCINTEGSYRCECKTGFENKQEDSENQHTMSNSNETALKVGQGMKDLVSSTTNLVENTEQLITISFMNVSKAHVHKMRSSPVSATQCVDIDECSLFKNSPNSFTGNFTQGIFSSVNDNLVQSAVQKSSSWSALKYPANQRCHPDLAKCTNTFGSFICECNHGYEGNGMVCTDVNECHQANIFFFGSSICGRNSFCVNLVGSFVCQCLPGFAYFNRTKDVIDNSIVSNDQNTAIATNQHSPEECSNIDECLNGNNNCDPTTSRCVDTVGSFKCVCKNGFSPRIENSSQTETLGNYTVSCLDVNECFSEELNNCHENARCSNTKGSFQCICLEGYFGDGKVNCTRKGLTTFQPSTILEIITFTRTPISNKILVASDQKLLVDPKAKRIKPNISSKAILSNKVTALRRVSVPKAKIQPAKKPNIKFKITGKQKISSSILNTTDSISPILAKKLIPPKKLVVLSTKAKSTIPIFEKRLLITYNKSSAVSSNRVSKTKDSIHKTSNLHDDRKGKVLLSQNKPQIDRSHMKALSNISKSGSSISEASMRKVSLAKPESLMNIFLIKPKKPLVDTKLVKALSNVSKSRSSVPKASKRKASLAKNNPLLLKPVRKQTVIISFERQNSKSSNISFAAKTDDRYRNITKIIVNIPRIVNKFENKTLSRIHNHQEFKKEDIRTNKIHKKKLIKENWRISTTPFTTSKRISIPTKRGKTLSTILPFIMVRKDNRDIKMLKGKAPRTKSKHLVKVNKKDGSDKKTIGGKNKVGVKNYFRERTRTSKASKNPKHLMLKKLVAPKIFNVTKSKHSNSLATLKRPIIITVLKDAKKVRTSQSINLNPLMLKKVVIPKKFRAGKDSPAVSYLQRPVISTILKKDVKNIRTLKSKDPDSLMVKKLTIPRKFNVSKHGSHTSPRLLITVKAIEKRVKQRNLIANRTFVPDRSFEVKALPRLLEKNGSVKAMQNRNTSVKINKSTNKSLKSRTFAVDILRNISERLPEKIVKKISSSAPNRVNVNVIAKNNSSGKIKVVKKLFSVATNNITKAPQNIEVHKTANESTQTTTLLPLMSFTTDFSFSSSYYSSYLSSSTNFDNYNTSEIYEDLLLSTNDDSDYSSTSTATDSTEGVVTLPDITELKQQVGINSVIASSNNFTTTVPYISSNDAASLEKKKTLSVVPKKSALIAMPHVKSDSVITSSISSLKRDTTIKPMVSASTYFPSSASIDSFTDRQSNEVTKSKKIEKQRASVANFTDNNKTRDEDNSPLEQDYKVLCYWDKAELLLKIPPFYKAIIYGKPKLLECQREIFSNSPRASLKTLQFGYDECGAELNINGGMIKYTLGIILTTTPPLITKNSQSFTIMCSYPITEIKAVSDVNISTIRVLSRMGSDQKKFENFEINLKNTPAPINCYMNVVDKRRELISEANVGEILMLYIKCSDPSYRINGYDCWATDINDEKQRVQLIDENGCSLDPDLVQNFRRQKRSNSIFALFKAFKFPFDSNIRFECRVKPCIGQCQLNKCEPETSTNDSDRKRKRRDINQIKGKIEEPIDAKVLYSVLSIKNKGSQKAENYIDKQSTLLTKDIKKYTTISAKSSHNPFIYRPLDNVPITLSSTRSSKLKGIAGSKKVFSNPNNGSNPVSHSIFKNFDSMSSYSPRPGFVKPYNESEEEKLKVGGIICLYPRYLLITAGISLLLVLVILFTGYIFNAIMWHKCKSGSSYDDFQSNKDSLKSQDYRGRLESRNNQFDMFNGKAPLRIN